MTLEQNLISFLKRNYNPQKSVLIGLSGGPDSLALLYLLLNIRKNFPISIGIAHVDHGWRPESAAEASQLKEIATQYQLPFHLHTLSPKAMTGNLEAACRLERLHFFKRLCQEYGYQAVFLGHHADDQAETVLKRVLEGSALTHFAALKEVNQIEGIALWRPFLSVTKKTILKWLEEHNLVAFDDYTNNDPTFLRGKLRTQIIPHLSENFGKQISSNLCHLAEETLELKRYLDQNIEGYLSQVEKGCWGQLLDLSIHCPKSSFELKHLLRTFCAHGEMELSRSILDSACEILLSGKGNRQLAMGKKCLQIDRKRVFLLDSSIKISDENRELPLGGSMYGNWHIEAVVGKYEQHLSNWLDVWKGCVKVTLPMADYQLGPAITKAVSHHWTNAKVPAFLRYCVPVIYNGKYMQHEFLSGKRIGAVAPSGECLHLSLKYKIVA